MVRPLFNQERCHSAATKPKRRVLGILDVCLSMSREPRIVSARNSDYPPQDRGVISALATVRRDIPGPGPPGAVSYHPACVTDGQDHP